MLKKQKTKLKIKLKKIFVKTDGKSLIVKKIDTNR